MKLIKTYTIDLQQIIKKNIDEYSIAGARDETPFTTIRKYLVCAENKKYLGTYSKDTLDTYKKYVYRKHNMLELRDTKKYESILHDISDEMFYTYY